MDTLEQKLRLQICDIGRNLFNKDFIAANDGNISARLSENVILTTPRAVSKGYLEPHMLVKVNLQGEVLEAAEGYRPSTEAKMHLRIYNELPEMKGVVHAHPPYATAFAIKGEALDKMMMPESVIMIGDIPLAEYGTPSTEEIPDSLMPFLGKKTAVLLENHGALTWGEDVMEAYLNMERLEYTAKLTFITRMIGGERELPQHRIDELVALRSFYGK
ncbi:MULTISPECIES: class II aldolase/adducin family protein [Paenibacillus]|jgi:L-fuculose-phosphate aldolase|uniref:Aldolase n=1 Tax=Paenibacillus odorifer TaxID=189426 RepID=A0A1R0YYC6_9BACL|nr:MULTISPECIES: class II aldolase/adducin family protein [Paenibacillus]AIQ73145.1 aldolase [Paenibacillus odorifer]AWV32492.1 aldolase [Paenibacillus odorifer]MDH6425953.1 L-fuculose-phosphate aldolase [Paenibacillus sp. PastH-4]MDH6441974.1 L-fuculose-phosphate aldolase [Paenibacillus sp. PastF-4]MDH6527311.1 L-fuculose-phosphate aldolase [Paenibacillus sp. PastH-3]